MSSKKLRIRYKNLEYWDFSHIFQKLIKEKKIKKSWLAKELGVSQTTIFRWLSGENYPDARVLLKLADILGVSVQYLLTGKDPPRPAYAGIPNFELVSYEEWLRKINNKEPLENFVAIPLVSGYAACGAGAVLENEIESFVVIYQEWCRKNPKNYLAVRIIGDSMLPTLRDGDIVAIDKTQRNPERLIKKLVAVNSEDFCYIKRLTRTKSGLYIATSDNRDELEDFEIEPAQIIGKVVWAWTRFD